MSYGTVQAEKMTTESGYSLGAGNASSFKNRLINGGMVIDQRNAGASVNLSVTPAYITDRWESRLGTSTGSTSQRSSVAPSGFSNSLLLTIGTGSAPAASDGANYLNQKIEGFNCEDLAWGTADAKSATLSFWVRSSLTGSFGVALTNDSINPSYPASYTINAANTWEYKTITIPGPTSGTFTKGTTAAIRVFFDWGNGSNFKGPANVWANADYRGGASGTVNICATSGATWYMTGCQLEVGTVATSFDVRPYGTELALCQRYFIQYQGDSGNAAGLMGYAESASSARFFASFPVAMRASPTAALSGTARFQSGSTDSANFTGITSTTTMQTPFIACAFSVTTSNMTTNAGGSFQFQANGSKLTFSAEL
jgi:hypothetical protein